jgi:hypothetical protein
VPSCRSAKRNWQDHALGDGVEHPPSAVAVELCGFREACAYAGRD